MNEIRIENKEAIQKLKSFRDNYTSQNKFFISWLEETGNDICEDSIREFFLILNNSDYKAATIYNKREACRSYIRQLFKDKAFEVRYKVRFMLEEICSDIKKPIVKDNSNSGREELDLLKINMVVSRCRSDKQISFIKFIFYTGLRVGEMIKIKISDCAHVSDSVAIVINGKSKKERAIIIDKELYNFIMKTFDGKYYLFETKNGTQIQTDYISKEVRKVCSRAGFRLSAHSLRHSFATEMIKKHPDKIKAISKYLGHAHVSSTMGYLHTKLSKNDLLN